MAVDLGVELSTDTLTDAATSPVTLGVAFGLVVGNLVRMASPANLDRWVPFEQKPLAEVNYSRVGLAIAPLGTDLSKRRTGKCLTML